MASNWPNIDNRWDDSMAHSKSKAEGARKLRDIFRMSKLKHKKVASSELANIRSFQNQVWEIHGAAALLTFNMLILWHAKVTNHLKSGSLKVFLVALFFAYMSKTMSGAYVNSMLTQIERRFNIPTSLVGIISGSFEMGNLLVIAFVSYLGAKCHRPRLIGVGCTIMALGCFLIGLPHFLMGRYQYESSASLSENSFTSISTSTCLANDTVPTEQPSEDCEEQVGSSMWVFVLVGNIIRGIGETPITPLGISYVEDFAKVENSPFYIGCLQIATVMGPLFGLMMGSYCAQLFVDLGFVDLAEVTLSLLDARWVGAWWLGILLCAGVSLLVAIPFFFLPRTLPKEGEEHNIELRDRTLLQTESISQTNQKISEIAKDFIPYLKRLFYNPIYMLFILITAVQFNAYIGMLTFMPKYLEQQYGISASDAIYFVGVSKKIE
uniref:Uncharacterized protein n=1 Tax=Sphaerodactylus townsendi TaxID=933632 RepID=A0ACB8FMS8_9SAUR